MLYPFGIQILKVILVFTKTKNGTTQGHPQRPSHRRHWIPLLDVPHLRDIFQRLREVRGGFDIQGGVHGPGVTALVLSNKSRIQSPPEFWDTLKCCAEYYKNSIYTKPGYQRIFG